MQTEIEVKFLDINADILRKDLANIGAKLIAPERLMRRINFDFPDMRLGKGRKAWVRVRDEANSITVSYKQANDAGVTGTQEINLNVDSFEQANALLEAIGMAPKSYQETKRESWVFCGVQIEIDTWPWVPTFVELEGTSINSLRAVASKLSLNWDTHQAGDVSLTYQHYYNIERDEIILNPRTTFEPVPDWLKAKQRKETA
jgi:adenylate cyclase class 2